MVEYRFPALHERQQAEVKMLLHEACIRYGYRMIALEVMPDHIHVFLSAGPNDTPSDIVRRLKGYTGHWLLQNDRYLRKFYSRKKALWGRGYYAATAGHVSAKTIRRYIEGQRQHHGKEEE